MHSFALASVGAAVALVGYAYVGYPVLLWMLGMLRPRRWTAPPPREWPRISITLPAYNEEAAIAASVESLLAVDYPPYRRQILVVSDASTDRTDAVVAGFAERGVELVRIPVRRGKTAAENAARPLLTGEIIVNTDASVRIHPAALKRLVAAFADPTIGVASGRDVSVSRQGDAAHVGEAGYVGYEMWVRELETNVSGIVGASGCLYAIRAPLHMTSLPEALSRDFAAALIARERGYRAVSVPDAVCFVPRVASIRPEYRRKVRTITRGLGTLLYKRHLLNPFRHGAFAWMLFSHKVCRWAVPWAGVLALAGIAALSLWHPWARWVLGGIGVALAVTGGGWMWPGTRPVPRALALPTYLLLGNLAVLEASVRAVRGQLTPVWEPTRREPVDAR